jgi:hypothetical protein
MNRIVFAAAVTALALPACAPLPPRTAADTTTHAEAPRHAPAAALVTHVAADSADAIERFLADRR